MARTVSLGVLEQVRIASPCSVPWESMAPVEGDRVRHCGACKLNVYNLSGMSRRDAEAIVRRHATTGTRLCAQLRVRADGTVLTQDCPIGLRAARARLARALTRLSAAAAFFLTGMVFARSRASALPGGLARAEPFATLCRWVSPPRAPAQTQFIRGEIAIGQLAPAPPPNGR